MTDYRKNAAPPEPLRREPPVLQRRWRHLDEWCCDNVGWLFVGCVVYFLVAWAWTAW